MSPRGNVPISSSRSAPLTVETCDEFAAESRRSPLPRLGSCVFPGACPCDVARQHAHDDRADAAEASSTGRGPPESASPHAEPHAEPPATPMLVWEIDELDRDEASSV